MTQMPGRLYMVENDDEMTLVRAISPNQAIGHVTQDKFKVRVATADDVATYMSLGGEIEISNSVKELMPQPESTVIAEEDNPSTGAE